LKTLTSSADPKSSPVTLSASLSAAFGLDDASALRFVDVDVGGESTFSSGVR
jgi:hypothetical protein